MSPTILLFASIVSCVPKHLFGMMDEIWVTFQWTTLTETDIHFKNLWTYSKH